MTQPIIERHDLPPGTFLDTREGMKMAYGILWKTWIDKVFLESVAASTAREILRAELTANECREGIVTARALLSDSVEGKPTDG